MMKRRNLMATLFKLRMAQQTAIDANEEFEKSVVQSKDVTVEEETCDVDKTIDGRISVTCDEFTTNDATQFFVIDSQTVQAETGQQMPLNEQNPRKKILKRLFRGVYVEQREEEGEDIR